jgi:head-tail adaptor
MTMRAGDLRERLVIQENVWPAIAVTLTRTGTTATGTTATAHNYVTGDYVTVAGATPSGYNGRVKVTVTGATTFTYTVDGSLATPATGTPMVTFASDAQGGHREHWVTKVTVQAELMPIGATERLQLQAIASIVLLRFRVRRRGDLTPAMRASWRPSWLTAAATQLLEIHGVLPDGNGVQGMFLDCGVVR